MTYLYATLLGIVQGLTEFLPVSSSAHLILARAFFGWESEVFGLAFDVACHVGTLAAVLYYFRADLGPMIGASPTALFGGGGDRGHVVRLVAIGTLPIVIFGLLASDWLQTLRTPVVCAVTLTIGAIGMMIAERVRATSRGDQDITVLEAVAIGCGQAAALFPGMSRSGTTITIAMLLGVRREAAARFTFLMSIPAVVAVAAKETIDVAELGVETTALALYAVGGVVSGVVGYLAVKYFIQYLANHSLDLFAYYRFALAAAVVVWLLV